MSDSELVAFMESLDRRMGNLENKADRNQTEILAKLDTLVTNIYCAECRKQWMSIRGIKLVIATLLAVIALVSGAAWIDDLVRFAEDIARRIS